VVCPESLKVRQGFARDDLFVCVHEQFMTETAAMADVVLPATTFLEHDDMYIASGHTFLQVTRKVIEPLGACRSNHEVICALARRLGAEHPGFEMSAWEIMDRTLKASGKPGAEALHGDHWLDCALPFETAHFLDGFPTPSGRFRFQADWASVGANHGDMPRLAGHYEVIDAPDAARPFRLVTAPARQYLNTSFTETPTSIAREARPTLLIHPDAAGRLGLADGALARVGNDLAEVVLHARLFDGLQPGVIVVESIWPSAAFRNGVGINALVSAEPGRPGGGAVFHDTAVWVRPEP
jgi:anaerobic selenocysteine-containing dehydrogenase